VTSLKYMPSDDDVLKARLKTVGVSEYKFEMEFTAGRDSGTEWRIVDVGGSRSQRRESFKILTYDPLMLISSWYSDVGPFL
jgi:guanine nucleotide-binding protein alpha-1 subunit